MTARIAHSPMTPEAYHVWRLQHGLSHTAIARLTGRSRTSVTRWELPNVGPPRGVWAWILSYPPVAPAHARALPHEPLSPGRAFRAFRVQHGFSQREIGQLNGYSANGVLGWEHDRAPVPVAVRAWMRRLSPALGEPAIPPMRPEVFKALRVRFGWALVDFAERFGSQLSAPHGWEHGRFAVPPHVAAWLREQPLPKYVAKARTSPTGLRQYMERHRLRCIEMADYLGVAECTIERWLKGSRPLPLAVQAWLRAGCPLAWRWRPPGLEPNVLTHDGRKRGSRAVLRPLAHVHRQHASKTIRGQRSGRLPMPPSTRRRSA